MALRRSQLQKLIYLGDDVHDLDALDVVSAINVNPTNVDVPVLSQQLGVVQYLHLWFRPFLHSTCNAWLLDRPRIGKTYSNIELSPTLKVFM